MDKKRSAWEKRVIKYETWFDQFRISKKKFFQEKDNNIIIEQYMEGLRETAIIAAYITLMYQKNGKIYSSNDFANANIEKINQQLPFPIPKGHFVNSVFQLVKEQSDFIRFVMENRYGVNSISDSMKNKMCLFDIIDAVICFLYPYILMSPNTELMVINGDLVDKVLASKNTILTAEDLVFTPFNQCFLEFHRPVVLLSHNNRKVSARGVGFYKDHINNCYSVIWFNESSRFTSEDIIGAMCAVMFSPSSKLQRIIIDDPTREELQIQNNKNVYVGGNIIHSNSLPDLEKDLIAFNQEFEMISNQLLEKSRNIWDFVTSRNIDYELINRNKVLQQKMKKRTYQHSQGKFNFSPRVFKILKINQFRKEKELEGHGKQTNFGYKEHIPGCFHKWIYCKQCDRVHRHDLIGKPCRRCNKIVGPISNIVIKKFWHEDYWRGEGETKEIVREIQN